MRNVLSWRGAPGNLATAVFAHRAAWRGHAVELSDDGYTCEAGLAKAAARFGLGALAGHRGAEGPRVVPPRIVLYCGAAIGYPYYAYYSHCLWSLGLGFTRAVAADIAGGLLDDADLLILPGGFATWGLDRAEALAGVDAAIRAFIARGGACIGSCGGSFYLSEGRPGWLGLIDAKPRYTHEYLLTGACLLNLRLTDPQLRRDLPETLELAYYHGPVYEHGERASPTLAEFGEHVMPSRLFIDNPIDMARYDTVMRDRVAVLGGTTPSARVIGFSPHPEMGEFLRKGMAFDGYVRHYLPIRGYQTMDETLRFYAGEDCIGFRLVLNAALMLGTFAKPVRKPALPRPSTALPATLMQATPVMEACAARLLQRAALEEPALERLIADELQRRLAEWHGFAAALTAEPLDAGIGDELIVTLNDALAMLAAGRNERRLMDMLVLLELPVRLLGACARIGRCDRLLEEVT